MSAIAIEILSDGIILAADGVCYEYETGAVRGFASKLIACPELDCAIGWTGVSDFGRALYLEIGDWFEDFDHFTDNLEDVARNTHHAFMERHDLYDHPTRRGDVSVVVAGWSNREQKYTGYRVFSYPKATLNMATGETIDNEPWTAIRLPEFWCSYAPAKEFMDACGMEDPNSVPVGELAPRMICAARAASGIVPHEVTGEPQVFNAGCFLQMVQVQRGNIHTWIAHRWPEDEIGAQIDPTKGELLPDWLMRKETVDG